MKRIAISVVLALFTALTMAAAASAQCNGGTVSIQSNFNGTAISPGNYIWFNSHLNASGISSTQPTTIYVTNASLNINGQVYAVPNAQITYDPNATTPSTHYDAASNTWITVVPTSGNGNVFMTGIPIQFPMGLAGGQNPVTLTATFSSSTPGVSGSFQWSAAVYTQMPSDYNQLGVKVTDQFGGSDHAGTPENYKHFVTGGARGGGGSNFTGSWSATGHFTTCTTTPTPTPTPTPTTTPTTTPTPPFVTPTPPTTTPEPATIILFGSGLMSIGGAAARRFFKRKKESDDSKDSE